MRAVRGDGFDESPENLMVLAEAESQKTAFLLNALSHMTNNQVMLDQMDQIVAEIQTTLRDRNQVEIPEEPNPNMERPVTSSSQRSDAPAPGQE